MNTQPSPAPLILVLVAAILPIIAADSRPSLAMRDAATHDQLSQSLRMAQQKDPLRDLGPAIGDKDKDPAKQETPRDLIKESTILCYRGFLTLIPKRAVLHLPPHLKDRFEEKPNIKIQPWREFYQANRGWIRTIEVTREQAMGQAPMPEETVKSFENSTSAIVAVFKGGPISVMPYVAPEPESGAGEGKNPASLTSAQTKETDQP